MSEMSRLIRVKMWSVNLKCDLIGLFLLAAAKISGAHIHATICGGYLSQYACGNPIRGRKGKA
jgi:hypothetical protein